MRQYLETLHHNTKQYFLNDQCMMLQSNLTWKKTGGFTVKKCEMYVDVVLDSTM